MKASPILNHTPIKQFKTLAKILLQKIVAESYNPPYFKINIQMRYFFCIIFYILLSTNLHWVHGQGYTVLEGKINIPAGKDVSVNVVTNLLTGERVIISTPVDYSGNFKLAFKPSVPMLVRFEHAFENMLIYVIPGERLKISFEAERMWQTVKFEGQGADNNNYLVEYFNKFGKEVDQTYIDLQMQGMMPATFAQYADSVKREKMEFCETYRRTHTFTKGFEEYAKGDILYNWGYDRIRYAAAQFWQVGDSYFKFLDQIPVQNKTLQASNSYMAFLGVYFDYMYNIKRLNGEKTQAAVIEKYQMIKSKLSDDLLYYMLARHIIKSCEKEEVADIASVYHSFELTNPYYEYSQVVGKAFSMAKKFAPGAPAPDFLLTDLDGKTVSLSDFRGKVVYLDFWASWCNPCLQQMRHIKERKNELEGSDIVFLFISIDTDEKAWRDIIAKRDIQGLHLRSPGMDSPTAKDYNIQGIPVHFMIDREGNFVGKTPMPSSRDAFLRKVESLVSVKTKE